MAHLQDMINTLLSVYPKQRKKIIIIMAIYFQTLNKNI